MLSKLWLDCDDLENNMVFSNLSIDAMGQSAMNAVIASVITGTEE